MTEPLSARAYLLQLQPRQVLEQLGALHDLYAKPKVFQARSIQSFARSLVLAGHNGVRVDGSTFFTPWSVRQVADDDRTAREWMGEVAKDLFQATAYQVTADMVEVVTTISSESQRRAVEYIEEPELPAPYGFAWFDTPMILIDGSGRRTSFRAVSWGLTTINWRGAGPTSAVRILCWSRTHLGDPHTLEDPPEAQYYGDLQLMHPMTIAFGSRFGVPTGVVDEDGTLQVPEGTDSGLHYVHVLWQLLGAEIAANARARVDRSAGKPVLRSISQTEVNVITLRRLHQPRPDSDAPPAMIDWSIRWLVSGHWRHIDTYDDNRHHFVPDRSRGSDDKGHPYCASCGGRGTWVKPFIKGPDGAPLKHTDQLYRLAR